MPFPIVQTKLHIPPIPAQMVQRSRLTQRLNEPSNCVTLLSAPAGFGKTTLVGEWISQCQQPVAWLALDVGDNDPARFFAYLIAAVQTIQSTAGQAAQTLLQSPQPPPLDAVMGTLINDLDALSQSFILVLDDYHVIQTQAIHDALAFLVEHLPASMRVVIASRADPPIPLARLRAQGRLTEIRVNDLRFTTDEAATFLCLATHLDLAPEAIAKLAERTEGWVAGLQLAAISMRGRQDIAGFIRAFGGSHRYILDYLAEQVLAQQPTHIQNFLLHTSILDRLSAPLCDAVVDNRELFPTGGQSILEYLEASNLFIIPLDDERRWYRYHHLFADLLRFRLQQSIEPTVVTTLHHRAAEWLEQNGLPADAVSHLLAAGDVEQAARLIEQLAPTLFWAQGQVTTVLGWAHALPEEQIRARPRLGLTLVWTQMAALQFDAAEQRLREVERASGAALKGMQGEIAAARVMLANFRGEPRIVELCHAALERLPEDAWFLRGIILGNLGGALATRGEVTAACDAFAEASRVSQQIGNTFMSQSALCYLAEMELLAGRLHRAAEIYQQVIDRTVEQGALAAFAGMANVGMGRVLYEWNDLEQAARYLASAIELGEGQGDNLAGPGWQMLAAAYLAFARVLQSRGEIEQARETLQKAEAMARQHDPSQLARMAAARARLELAAGDHNASARWMRESGLNVDDETGYAREFEHLTFARVLIARGRGDAAMKLLERVRQAAELAGRAETVIEACVLQALALDSQNKRDESTTVLERALSLAEPEGHARMFLDEGDAVAKLLARVTADPRRPTADYAGKLLVAFAPPIAIHRPSSAVDALSERELEVLKLIAAGYSNQEIAEKLVITVTTVKKHVGNIFGKMGVTSRTQAVAQARERRLI